MALFNIGGVRAELHPFNIDRAEHETNEDFARHPVIGARQTFESVGHGAEKLEFRGVLFPRRIGGLAELELLQMIQSSAMAILVTRGTTVMGWFHILSVKRNDRWLDAEGTGQKVEIQIALEKTDAPSYGQAANLVTRLFGYV